MTYFIIFCSYIFSTIYLLCIIKYNKYYIIQENKRRSLERSKLKKINIHTKQTPKLNKTTIIDLEDKYKNITYNDLITKVIIEFINTVTTEKIDPEKYDKLFKSIQAKHKIQIKKNESSFIINKLKIKINNDIKNYLITKFSRGGSGVNVATIVLKPGKFSCPHKCTYCPTEKNRHTLEYTQPKSYLSSEPAMLRALEFKFSVIGQIWNRIYTYIINGTITTGSKLEIIISGGTWESYPYDYRNEVSRDIYWAANTYLSDQKLCSEFMNRINKDDNFDIYNNEYIRPPKTLEEEKMINSSDENEHKVIGITVETRPDYITKQSIIDYVKWGFTRVQIGIQHTNNKVLSMNKRDSSIEDAIRAIRLLKINCFKVVVHIMPDLYGSSPELDLEMFKLLLVNTDLYFDDIKIYPTAICDSNESTPDIIVESELKDLYDKKIYKPYAETQEGLEKLIKILIFYKENIQQWVRIQRLVRDIPTTSMIAGYNKCVNLRDLLKKKYKVKCNDIRCHEIKDTKVNIKNIYLVVQKFKASKGTEYFISIQVHDHNFYFYFNYLYFLIKLFLFKIIKIIIYFLVKLKIFSKFKYLNNYTIYFSGCKKSYNKIIGFCRLRLDDQISNSEYMLPILNKSAKLRELHVYSFVLNTKTKNNYINNTYQHKGYGQYLVNVAENITIMNGLNQIAIISGVGVRKYYENKLGYILQDNFMIKKLNNFA